MMSEQATATEQKQELCLTNSPTLPLAHQEKRCVKETCDSLGLDVRVFAVALAIVLLQ